MDTNVSKTIIKFIVKTEQENTIIDHKNKPNKIRDPWINLFSSTFYSTVKFVSPNG